MSVSLSIVGVSVSWPVVGVNGILQVRVCRGLLKA